MKNYLKKEHGFTLIEIMIVVVIIAILATVVTPQFGIIVKKSKETKLKENLKIIRNAVDIEYTRLNGKYPPEITTSMFKERVLPEDIIKEKSDVVISNEDPITVNSTEGGWIYNPATGEVRINNTDKDVEGKPYSFY